MSSSTVVASAEAPMFARLFPIKIAVSSFFGFLRITSNWAAPFILFSIKLRSFSLLIAVNAVSALEKKAESKMNIIKEKNLNNVNDDNFYTS
jgi:hypothetical protein